MRFLDCRRWNVDHSSWCSSSALKPPTFEGLQEDGYFMKYTVWEEALLRKRKQQVKVVYFNTTKCFFTIKELDGIVDNLVALFQPRCPWHRSSAVTNLLVTATKQQLMNSFEFDF